jgi:hypothetical protein
MLELGRSLFDLSGMLEAALHSQVGVVTDHGFRSRITS